MGTAQLLAQHFTDERLANGLYGLYSKYRNYVEPLSCFLQIVAYSVVACTLTNSQGTLSQNSKYLLKNNMFLGLSGESQYSTSLCTSC